jgi:hypothetical protein
VSRENGDSTGVDFIAFRKLRRHDLTGVVSASQWLGPVEVDLFAASAPTVLVKTATVIKAMPYFEFVMLPEVRTRARWS